MDDDGNAGEPVNVARDTLVEFMCKSGGREKNEKYQVLGIFCKYYNKWFVSLQEIIGWGENNPEEKLKKTLVMARLMDKSGSSVKEFKMEKGGKWGPHNVYFVKGIDEVLGVEGVLE